MSERKVINKYYPPDFDATKIPRGPQRPIKPNEIRTRQITIRLMAPMSMRCNTCGEYIYKGKKFNARQETVRNEDYLGLRIYRFYIKCPCCISEITFKTDPANTDYAMEHGATRTFQAARIADKQEEDERLKEEEEERINPMQALETRTKESRLEMEKLEHLEELRDLNKRHGSVDFDSLIVKHLSQYVEEEKKNDMEDDNLVKQHFYADSKVTPEVIADDFEGSPKKKEHLFQAGRIKVNPKIHKSLVRVKKAKETNDQPCPSLNLVTEYSSSGSEKS